MKLRAGQLSYKEDPMGWRSLLAQTVTHRNSEARLFKVSLPHGFPGRNAASRKAEGSTADRAVLLVSSGQLCHMVPSTEVACFT